MNLGEFISKYLEEHDLSQRQFAKRCGLSNGYISMLINRINPKTGKPLTPSLEALLAISTGLGVTMDDLFEAVDDMDVDISGITKMPATMGNGRAKEFLELFTQLTPEEQDMFISQIKGVLASR